MRHVFFGSPPFAVPVLTALLESRHDTGAVVTVPEKRSGRGRKRAGSALVDAARAAGVPVYRPEDPHEPGFLAELSGLGAGVFAIASYGRILRAELYDAPLHGTLNVHASLLPRWRGASPIQAALLAGDAETGVSVQRIVDELDAGDIVVTRSTPIEPRETAGELLARLAVLGGQALVAALDALEAGRARFTPQDPTRVTFARKLTKDAGRIDWSVSAERVDRHVRAMTPWPGARTRDPAGRDLTLFDARALAGPAAGLPGEIVEVGPRFVVACGSGRVAVGALQAAGKRTLPAAEFLRGARLAAGQRLG